MSELTDHARMIIQNACVRIGNPYEVARFYGIGVDLVRAYQREESLGSLTARKVVRVEMGRMAAQKNGEVGWKPTGKDQYKGG